VIHTQSTSQWRKFIDFVAICQQRNDFMKHTRDYHLFEIPAHGTLVKVQKALEQRFDIHHYLG